MRFRSSSRSRATRCASIWPRWKTTACCRRDRPGPPAVGPSADRPLFNTGTGCTGRTFDWSLLKGRADLPRAFLAGGIGPANAAAAARLGAFGLDLSSGIEAAPGIKVPKLLRALFDALRPLSRKELSCA